jgi:hypothetical protein
MVLKGIYFRHDLLGHDTKRLLRKNILKTEGSQMSSNKRPGSEAKANRPIILAMEGATTTVTTGWLGRVLVYGVRTSHRVRHRLPLVLVRQSKTSNNVQMYWLPKSDLHIHVLTIPVPGRDDNLSTPACLAKTQLSYRYSRDALQVPILAAPARETRRRFFGEKARAHPACKG